MSAEYRKRIRRLGFAMAFGILGGSFASAEEVPDLEFLEYLGSWEESDEDWLLFNQLDAEQAKTDAERSDPVPEGEESTEKDDEL
jgi:hypothetical protein